MTHPFFLTVAYRGTGFHGWQIQSSLRSAQGDLWTALKALESAAPLPQGTGRTDAGVHARAQGVLVKVARLWEPYRLLAALNAHLPWDLRVMDARPAPEGFFPRQHAVAKRYVYRLGEGPAKDPLRHRLLWHVHGSESLDREGMTAAADLFLGAHDFTSFRCADCVAPSPIRTLHALRIEPTEGGMDLIFEGNKFLMHQVRIMTGTLVEVGKGRRPPESIVRSLAALDRSAAGPTAPPDGLCLEKVWYEARWKVGDPSPFGEREDPTPDGSPRPARP